MPPQLKLGPGRYKYQLTQNIKHSRKGMTRPPSHLHAPCTHSMFHYMSSNIIINSGGPDVTIASFRGLRAQSYVRLRYLTHILHAPTLLTLCLLYLFSGGISEVSVGISNICMNKKTSSELHGISRNC